jgi:hypothetical protein
MATRGRPVLAAGLRKKRIVFMADEPTISWLFWRSAETGASTSEIIRRAVKAYIAAHPAPEPEAAPGS